MPVIYLFDELLFDPDIFSQGDAQGGPEYDNSVIRNPPTGVYKVNVTRYDFQQVWSFDLNLISHDLVEYLMKIWVGGFGSAYGLRVRVVIDFFVKGEVLGTSDGTAASRTLYLTKTYRRPGADHQYAKRVIKPVVNANLAVGCPTLYEPNGSTPRVIPSEEGTANGVPAFTVFLDQGSGPVALSSGYTIDNRSGALVLAAKTFTAVAATDIFTIANHGYVANVGIKLQNSGGALPASLVAGTTYYVRDITTNTFKLSATPGGAAVNITTDGTGTNTVSGPPVGSIVSWSGEFDTPMRFLQNALALKPEVSSEVKGVTMVEILPAELGILL